MQKLTRLIFRVFVFFLPTQLAYHFWPDWTLIFGIRVDYLSPAVYFTDLLAGALIALSFFRKNKKIRPRRISAVGLVLLVFIFLNIFFAKVPPVAFFKWLKLLEVYLVFNIAKNFKELDFNKDFVNPLIVSSFFFSLIGISQFLKGGTIGGPFYFFGERSFNLLTPGISLFSLFGHDFLRPYSTFSHPNSLAGFFSVVLILAATQKKIHLKRGIFLMALGTILAGTFLAFSSGALVSIFLTRFLYRYLKKSPARAVFLVGAASIILLFVSPGKISPGFPESVGKRLMLAATSRKAFSENPIFGVGLNNFITRTPRFLQPVHNVYLLTLTETGIVGTGLFLGFFYLSLKRSFQKKNLGLSAALVFLAFAGLFDHYTFTLQQNLLLFSLVLGYSQRHEERR